MRKSVARKRFSLTFPQLEQNPHASLSDVSCRMLEAPHNAVNDKFEVLLRHEEERREAVAIDRADEVKEVLAMVWVILKVLCDHRQRRFEHVVQYPRHVVRHGSLQASENRGEQ
jgi:hypothetical protein